MGVVSDTSGGRGTHLVAARQELPDAVGSGVCERNGSLAWPGYACSLRYEQPQTVVDHAMLPDEVDEMDGVVTGNVLRMLRGTAMCWWAGCTDAQVAGWRRMCPGCHTLLSVRNCFVARHPVV